MGDDVPQRPTSDDDLEGWKVYWEKVQPPEWFKKWGHWRTQPEIDEVRKQYLANRRAIVPDEEQDIYPFSGIELSRADVEWLLATHESNEFRGPCDWDDFHQAGRPGLDLRGANLRGINLSNLPLSRLLGGQPVEIQKYVSLEAMEAAKLHREPAAIHLERSVLSSARLEGAQLRAAHLEGAMLGGANLFIANLEEAHLECADLGHADINGAQLMGAWLEDANMANAEFEQAYLNSCHMEGCMLWQANLTKASLDNSSLQGANLGYARLEGASLRHAYCGGKLMQKEDLARIRKWKRSPGRNHVSDVLHPAYFRNAFLDETTNLEDLTLGDGQYGYAWLGDVHWGGTNLAAIDWSKIAFVGEEYASLHKQQLTGVAWNASRDLKDALRANRQLSSALREQGLGDEADHFAFRAQVIQRRLLQQESRRLKWLLWCFLEGLAGYGYRPLRTLAWYGLCILLSAIIYCWQGAIFAPPHTPWHAILGTAIVDAFTALHGRGFFPTPAESGWQMGMAAFDAVAGLIIEASFIATFTQRYFGK